MYLMGQNYQSHLFRREFEQLSICLSVTQKNNPAICLHYLGCHLAKSDASKNLKDRPPAFQSPNYDIFAYPTRLDLE